jgi:hypothetical protein
MLVAIVKSCGEYDLREGAVGGSDRYRYEGARLS